MKIKGEQTLSGDATRLLNADGGETPIGTLVAGKRPRVYIATAQDQTTLTNAKMSPETLYYPNRASPNTVSLPLPTQAALGEVFYIRGLGSGGWTLTQSAGQIVYGAAETARGVKGSVSSGYRYDTLVFECVVANTDFLIIGKTGNHIYV